MRQTNILDPDFRYVPSERTNVAITWRRFGFKVNNAGRTDVASPRRRFGFEAGKYRETQSGVRSDTWRGSLADLACS